MTPTALHRAIRLVAITLLVIVGLTAGNGTVSAEQELPSGEALAPELSGLGTIHMAVTTDVPKAQSFFNQGIRLLYAFNHQEARRAFQEAARLDPRLSMAHWGIALTLAPNLNAPMTPEQGRSATDAIGDARRGATRAGAGQRAPVQGPANRLRAGPR